MRHRAQQSLPPLCVCAVWRRVDPGAQHSGQGAFGQVTAQPSEGRDPGCPAVPQGVGPEPCPLDEHRSRGTLTLSSLSLSRLEETLEAAEDIAIDIPHIWLYLAELITPMLHEGGIPMGALFRCCCFHPHARFPCC